MFNIIFKIERWKFNKDYGVYVSTEGHFKDRQKRLIPVKIGNGGYCNIKTERGYVLAHRLVMFTWRPIPNAEKLTVDHLNHNKRDNSLTNLEWVSKAENLKRAKRDQVEKLLSIHSTAIPEKIFLKHLVGYRVNGVVCRNDKEIKERVKFFLPTLSEEEINSKIKTAKDVIISKRVRNVRITKKVGIQPIMDIENLYKSDIEQYIRRIIK